MEVKRHTAKSLISNLSSVSDQTRISALCEIRLLSKHDPEIRPVLAEEGAVPYIADTLYSSTRLAQDNAAATLLNLSISTKETLISTFGVLDALSHALSNHRNYHPSAVQSAAATIYSLLTEENYRPVIGSKRDIVYALIDIIKTLDSPVRSIKDALKALFGLSLHPLNRSLMVEFGSVSALFGLVVKHGRVGVVEDATAVIAQIAGCEDSPDAFRAVSGVRVLVDLMDTDTGSSQRIKENAVSGLLNSVKFGGGVVVEEIRKVGLGLVFDGLGDVACNGTPKGKKRAEELMKIIEGGMNLSLKNSNTDSGWDLNSGPLLDSHSY